jgi:PAS domain S-box-containing protein
MKPWVFHFKEVTMAQKDMTKEELVEEIGLLKKRITELDKLYTGTWQKHQNIRRYETVVRDSNDSIIIQDLEGQITAWNRGAEKMYGYSEKEALGMNIENLTPPEKVAEHKELTRNLLAGKIIDSFETQRVTKDGSILDVWLTITKIVKDPEGDIITTGRDITNPIGIAMIERNISERRKSEEKVRLSELQIRSIFDSVGDAIYVLDTASGMILDCNTSACRELGYSREEILKLSASDIELRVKREDIFSMHQKVKSEGVSVEGTHKRKDGTTFPVEIHLTPLLPVQLGRLISVVRDITERKQLEEALVKSEKRYRTLFENSPDAIMTLDPPSWKFTSGNLAMVKMFMAKDKAFFTLHDPWSLSPERQPDGRVSVEKAKEMIEMAMRDGSNFFEWTHKRLNGEEFPVAVQLTRMVLSEKTIIQATISDITERKKEEMERQESESQYKMLVETTTTGYVVIDKEGTVLTANQEYVRLTGNRELHDIVGRNVFEWTADYEKEKNVRAVRECFENGKIRDLEIDYVDIQGKVTPIEINATMVKTKGKAIILTLCRDITERRKTEAETRKRLQELEVFYKASVGREERILELKKEIEQLEKGAGKNK